MAHAIHRKLTRGFVTWAARRAQLGAAEIARRRRAHHLLHAMSFALRRMAHARLWQAFSKWMKVLRRTVGQQRSLWTAQRAVAHATHRKLTRGFKTWAARCAQLRAAELARRRQAHRLLYTMSSVLRQMVHSRPWQGLSTWIAVTREGKLKARTEDHARELLAAHDEHRVELESSLTEQQSEHERLLAEARAAHEAVIAGQRQHLSESEMTALEAREAHEQGLLAANEEWEARLRKELEKMEAAEAAAAKLAKQQRARHLLHTMSAVLRRMAHSRLWQGFSKWIAVLWRSEGQQRSLWTVQRVMAHAMHRKLTRGFVTWAAR